jgi:pyruvate-formate lyase
MARQTKQEKQIDNLVEAAFNQHGHHIQFNVMDLGKIHRAGVDAVKAGQDLDAAMLAAIAQYRVA